MSESILRYSLPVLLLLAPLAQAQQPSRMLEAAGREKAGEILSPGAMNCVGGQAVGPLKCSPGTSKIFVWNWVSTQAYLEVAGTAAPMIDGTSMVVMHCNLDETYYGHCWGTFVWAVPDMGGIWEGVWSGTWNYATNQGSYKMTGYGTGGKLEGLHLEKETVGVGGAEPGKFLVKVSAEPPRQ